MILRLEAGARLSSSGEFYNYRLMIRGDSSEPLDSESLIEHTELECTSMKEGI